MLALPKIYLFASGVLVSVAAIGSAGYFAWKRAVLESSGADRPLVASAPVITPLATPALTPAPSPPLAPVASTGARQLRPQFDVVRVEPDGSAVVAGRAETDARIILLNKGETLAETTTDATGHFVILPHKLPPGDHLLTLRSVGRQGAVDSEQNVATFVPKQARESVVAVLASPNEPSRVLSSGPASTPAQALSILGAEAGDDGGFFASGSAPPGSSIKLYMNETLVAPVQAGPDGGWSLRVKRGMTPGHYDLRADAIDPANGRVTMRAAAPFDYPEPGRLAAAPAQKVAANSSAVSPPSTQAIVADIRSVTVERGDSLWRISRKVLGHGMRYTQIYEANASQIRDPNKIWPGQVFVAPAKGLD